MKTVKEIRIENLNRLIESHGSVAELSKSVGKAPAIISHMRAGRYFGEKSARDIEKSLSLPLGSLDHESFSSGEPIDHLLHKLKETFDSLKVSHEEQQLLKYFRSVSKKKRKSLMDMAEMLAESEHNQ